MRLTQNEIDPKWDWLCISHAKKTLKNKKVHRKTQRREQGRAGVLAASLHGQVPDFYTRDSHGAEERTRFFLSTLFLKKRVTQNESHKTSQTKRDSQLSWFKDGTHTSHTKRQTSHIQPKPQHTQRTHIHAHISPYHFLDEELSQMNNSLCPYIGPLPKCARCTSGS